jgi:mono/diheme cytochrome c family protein
MNRLGWFVFGALATCALAVAFLVLETNGFSAREKPGAMETSLARRVRTMAIPSSARDRSNPIANSPEVQAAARAHWADHCAICHGNDGSGETPMGSKTYPPAPDMRLAPTQQMTDGELFYIIENGIRFSGMPGWGSGSGHDETESWHLVHFIRHLPALTLEEKKEMERLNPKSPDEIKEEQEEEAFLKGETKNEPPTKHHH